MAQQGKKLTDAEIELIRVQSEAGVKREMIAAGLNCSVKTVERHQKRVRQEEPKL
jgi:DNA-binding NarL/FixJ family response regulator